MNARDDVEHGTAKLFKLNRSQAVRLPMAVAFPEGVEEVIVRREGRSVVITPTRDFWDGFFEQPGIAMAEPEELPYMLPKSAPISNARAGSSDLVSC